MKVGQIRVDGQSWGCVVSASYGPEGGSGTISYSDGTSQQFTLTGTNWFGGSGDTATSSAYQNMLNNQKYEHADNVYQVVIALQTGKTSVKADLPNVATA
ncbi:hypothetical protein ADL25_44875 [Streptomyces sp. NRRL F-5122]|nr:hypothetical protein ADL25_44875 [Streptomyces sp. NRRL F-5122]